MINILVIIIPLALFFYWIAWKFIKAAGIKNFENKLQEYHGLENGTKVCIIVIDTQTKKKVKKEGMIVAKTSAGYNVNVSVNPVVRYPITMNEYVGLAKDCKVKYNRKVNYFME